MFNELSHKIDFSAIITVTNANPNGDPLNGNRPRETDEGYGEISDVCIKRKIRNRLQDMGEKILLQSDDRCDDGCDSLQMRVSQNERLKKVKKTDRGQFAEIACEEWIDVRSFGQMFAFKGDTSTINVRGPISIHPVISVSPVNIVSSQIVKSVNGEGGKEGRSSDTMGMKHRVPFGMYIVHGSINCQLASKTGFNDEDADKIKEAICTLFENDASAARPEGSMEVCRVYWWDHDCKTPKTNSAKVHRSLQVKLKDGVTMPHSFDDYDISLSKIDGVEPEIIDLM